MSIASDTAFKILKDLDITDDEDSDAVQWVAEDIQAAIDKHINQLCGGKLSEEIKKWRADRPDEWIMDEFIRKAKLLEDENERLDAALTEINNGLKSEHKHSDTTSHIRAMRYWNKIIVAVKKGQNDLQEMW